MEYLKKTKQIKQIRQDIKKKRIILDENKTNFGLDELVQLAKVDNTIEIKGYPFKGISKSKGNIGIKVIPNEKRFVKTEHPVHLEYIILKEFTDNIVLKNISPHIVNYIGSSKISNKSKAVEFLNLEKLEREDKIRNSSIVILSEFLEGGSLDNWIFNTYENEEVENKKKNISDTEWKCVVFTILYTLYVLQDTYKFVHNDLHYGNILIDDQIKPGGYFVYKIKDNTWYLPNNGVIAKIWDTEFGMAFSDKLPNGYPNKFVIGDLPYNRKTHVTIDTDMTTEDNINIPVNYNKVYDCHYFLTSLLDLFISQETFDWIMSLYPLDLIPSDSSENSSEKDSENSSENSSENGSENSSENGSDNSSDYNSEDVISEMFSNFTISETKEFLHDGRIVNGVEELFPDLPIPYQLITSSFFDCFKQKPEDFDKNENCVFEYKIPKHV
jgi:hypothetical protein